ncbi:MAG: class I SAM-dependent methyltransferase [Chloroflexi bacterium]|nr:class I SAM-dependent methyltransferase [Chloroflexota bacterium]
MNQFTSGKVKTFFEEQDNYRDRKGMVHAEQDPVILEFMAQHADASSIVLEVGGGSGYMLDLVNLHVGPNRLYNCEIVPGTYRVQVNPAITLVGGDCLQLPFRSGFCDFVIIKNVLHHLVGGTRKQSKGLALQAVNELARVLRPGGHLIIVEQHHRHRLFADIAFWITMLFAKVGVGVPSLGLNKNVIVSFLTPAEIESYVRGTGTNIVVSDHAKVEIPFIYRVTILLKDLGRSLIIGKVEGGNQS